MIIIRSNAATSTNKFPWRNTEENNYKPKDDRCINIKMATTKPLTNNAFKIITNEQLTYTENP